MATALPDITTDSPDVQEDLISLDEINMWSIDAMKEFCRIRDFKVSGTKKELAARVYTLYNCGVTEKPSAKEMEASRRIDYKSLLNSEHPTQDPFKLSKWLGEKAGMKLWPPINCVDIDWFLKTNNGVGLTREGLSSYKSGKAFSYYYCDWLQEIFYAPMSKQQPCCYLKTECIPSNRLNNPPHKLRVKVKKETGEVISAYCSCVAG